MNAKGFRVITPARPYTRVVSVDEYGDRLRALEALEVAIDAAALLRAGSNPLAALATLAGLPSDKAAEVAGVTVGELEQEDVTGRLDRIERAIGRLALATLARLRGELRTAAIGRKAAEIDDPVEEVLNFPYRLANNRAFAKASEVDGFRIRLVKA